MYASCVISKHISYDCPKYNTTHKTSNVVIVAADIMY